MAKKTAKKKPVEKTLDFEDALEQLQQIVQHLEEGEVGLDESLRQYERGVKLLRRCHDLLAGAQRRIELLGGVDGQGGTEVMLHAVDAAIARPRRDKVQAPGTPVSFGRFQV